jgi:hypothetical protein
MDPEYVDLRNAGQSNVQYDRRPHGAGRPWRDVVATIYPSLAAQVRRQVEAHYPYAACDDCLAVLLVASVDELRAAAVVVALEDGFIRRLRVCYTCRRTVELTARE